MADPQTTPPTASPAVSDVNQDDESRMLLGFLRTYDPEAAFTCGWPSADLIASYRDECRRSNPRVDDQIPKRSYRGQVAGSGHAVRLHENARRANVAGPG